jgi:hypothetical protein
MAYLSRWERLSEALRRVMDATGLSKDEAQKDICQAIADRAINIQGKLGKHVSTGFTSLDTVLEGQAFSIPIEIKPEDLDWEGSRPVKSWTVRRGAFRMPGAWELELIQLCRANVTTVLCTGQPGESAGRGRSESDAISAGQPTLERSSRPQSPGTTGSRRSRGPRGAKFERVCGAMKGDIQQGRRSVDELSNMLEKDLSATYRVSRDTARKARTAVLAELGGN